MGWLRNPSRRALLTCTATSIVWQLGAHGAHAVPSFARQTGMACSGCHTAFPELTPLARSFKLDGYTMAGMEELQEPGSEKAPPLEINRVFPLSVMLQTSLTRTNKKQSGTQNDNVEFPQQLSLFLNGEITPHIGTFLQVTYSGQDDHFTIDDTDIRYANQTLVQDKALEYGITINNNPTVEDLWNSTPAWGFPFASADSAPTPAAAAVIDGTLAQQVAGVGPYARWNKEFYAVVTIYRSAHIGSPQPPTAAAGNTIEDVAPYWRLASEHNWGENYLELGTLGMFAQIFPNAVSGSANRFIDAGLDAQYERPIGNDFLSAHALYIFEHEDLSASHAAGTASNLTDKLHTVRLDGIYHWRSRLTCTLAYFLVHGTPDAELYAPESTTDDPAQVTGSVNGSPNSDGLIAEIAYRPWWNVRLSAQYTAYTQFNGRSHNYNGTGRDASANDTLYLLAWLAY